MFYSMNARHGREGGRKADRQTDRQSNGVRLRWTEVPNKNAVASVLYCCVTAQFQIVLKQECRVNGDKLQNI